MAFEDHYDRENWYHLLVEMVAGYSLSQSEEGRLEVLKWSDDPLLCLL